MTRLRLVRPYFHIHIGGDLYMRRWWLVGDEHARDAGEITAGIHHIVRPDRDRDFHTHPCTFISLVFWGWYRERVPRSQKQDYALDQLQWTERVRRIGSIAVRRATDRHAITKVAPKGAWTLVIWLRKKGSWGFATKNGFVNWRGYKRH